MFLIGLGNKNQSSYSHHHHHPLDLRALREMSRVLVSSPDSLVGILEFTAPTGTILAPIAKYFVRYVVPILGGLVSGNMDE